MNEHALTPAGTGSTTPSFLKAMAVVVEREELSDELMRSSMEEMLLGQWQDLEVAAFLAALRVKGESAGEIATAALVLREHMIRFETGRDDLLDTCGTGGDATGTFNISTAAALVAAGAGVPVAKHGNRAVSSRSGSGDVLSALGITLEEGLAWPRRCLKRAGLAFCFAPQFHPLLRHVGPVRRRLGMRTLFNCLGPLANPAGAAYQLLGVGNADMLDRLAEAVARLGSRRTFLVCGSDGLDEVTLSGTTWVREVRGNLIKSWEWTPSDFGLDPCSLEELVIQGPAESATLIRSILDNRESAGSRIVLANAAAALLAAERVDTLAEGVRQARAALASGRASQVLERLITCSVEADPSSPHAV